MSRLFVTIPHSGEKIPAVAPWLQALPETILMCDVDRYVDVLYEPTLKELQIPFVKSQWHRYAVDLNRVPTDIDAASVVGNQNRPGLYNRGFHWCVTTHNEPILKNPISPELHQELTDLIFTPFHKEVKIASEAVRKEFGEVFHIDAHSMPSVGTAMHKDPGERRAHIVVSDNLGKSCKHSFRDLVIAAYCTAGFKVGYNWPYVGGRLTEEYGHPEKNHHTIQVELNRALYMDEKTKKIIPNAAEKVQSQIRKALESIQRNLPV